MATATIHRPPIAPKRWNTLRYHATQQALWRALNGGSRFVAVDAGRRSGKTELCKRRLVLALRERKPWADPRYFFACPTRDQVKRVAWDDFLKLIPKQWVATISVSELCVKTIFGSSLWLVGMDRPERAEGVGWDGGVVDESSDQKSGLFDRSIRPALADRGGWCARIGVPKRTGPGAVEFREFCEVCDRGEYPGGARFTWPSSEILSASEIQHARETLDPKDFREQFEACWETAGGMIYYAFDRNENVRPCPYNPTQQIIVGSDFNVSPMAWVLGHRYENRMEWFDEIWLRDTNTPAALAVLASRYADHKGGFSFYGDASSRARKTSAVDTDYQLILSHPRFQQLGRQIHYPQANPKVADRWAATNAMFCNAAGQRRMFVDPACKHLIRDLEGRAYKGDTREASDPAGSDIGHITDAMDYAVYKLFPVRIKVPSSNRIIINAG